ncbi:hypothetical protein [Idiomarina sp.]|nr:hypothetical protein [Idiomarina sp.]
MAKSNGKSGGRGPSTHPGPGGNWPSQTQVKFPAVTEGTQKASDCPIL